MPAGFADLEKKAGGTPGLEQSKEMNSPTDAEPAEELQGWRFRVEPVPGGVRVVASANGGELAVWFVPRRRCGLS